MSLNKSDQILLLKKGKRGILRVVFGRTGIVALLLLAQMFFLFTVFRFIESLIPFTVGTLLLFTLMMVFIGIMSTNEWYLFYVFLAFLESIITALIVWYAWKWPKEGQI